MKRTLLILTFMMGSLTFAASAQYASERATIEDTFGIGPRLGLYQMEDADDGAFYGGIQARMRLGSVIGFEAAVDYRSAQEFDFSDFTAEVSSIPVTASLMIFAPISRHFAPYGLAGIGAYYTKYEYDAPLGLDLEDDSSFNLGYHLGAGVEFPFNQNIALNLDYRYIFLNPDENEESFNDATLNANVFTAGLMFYF